MASKRKTLTRGRAAAARRPHTPKDSGASPAPATTRGFRRKLARGAGIRVQDLDALVSSATAALCEELMLMDGRLENLEQRHRRHHDPVLEEVVDNQGRLMTVEALYRSLEARVAQLEAPTADTRSVLVKIKNLLDDLGDNVHIGRG